MNSSRVPGRAKSIYYIIGGISISRKVETKPPKLPSILDWPSTQYPRLHSQSVGCIALECTCYNNTVQTIMLHHQPTHPTHNMHNCIHGVALINLMSFCTLVPRPNGYGGAFQLVDLRAESGQRRPKNWPVEQC